MGEGERVSTHHGKILTSVTSKKKPLVVVRRKQPNTDNKASKPSHSIEAEKSEGTVNAGKDSRQMQDVPPNKIEENLDKITDKTGMQNFLRNQDKFGKLEKNEPIPKSKPPPVPPKPQQLKKKVQKHRTREHKNAKLTTQNVLNYVKHTPQHQIQPKVTIQDDTVIDLYNDLPPPKPLPPKKVTGTICFNCQTPGHTRKTCPLLKQEEKGDIGIPVAICAECQMVHIDDKDCPRNFDSDSYLMECEDQVLKNTPFPIPTDEKMIPGYDKLVSVLVTKRSTWWCWGVEDREEVLLPQNIYNFIFHSAPMHVNNLTIANFESNMKPFYSWLEKVVAWVDQNPFANDFSYMIRSLGINSHKRMIALKTNCYAAWHESTATRLASFRDISYSYEGMIVDQNTLKKVYTLEKLSDQSGWKTWHSLALGIVLVTLTALVTVFRHELMSGWWFGVPVFGILGYGIGKSWNVYWHAKKIPTAPLYEQYMTYVHGGNPGTDRFGIEVLEEGTKISGLTRPYVPKDKKALALQSLDVMYQDETDPIS